MAWSACLVVQHDCVHGFVDLYLQPLRQTSRSVQQFLILIFGNILTVLQVKVAINLGLPN